LDNTRAHLLQRIEHALHRPVAQRFIAIESCRDRRTGHSANRKTNAGSGISEIQHAGWLRKAPDSDPIYAPGLISGSLDPCAKRTHDVGGVQDVLAFQQTCDGAFTNCQGTKNERAVRNRLVAGHPDPSLDRAAWAGCQRRWF
jgi:hypothetical protein